MTGDGHETNLCLRYGFTPAERKRRVASLGLGDGDLERAAELRRRIVEPNIEHLVDRFYDHLHAHECFEDHLPNDPEGLQRLRGSMSRYLLTLGDDYESEIYFESRLRIGLTHRRIELPLSLYMAAYCVLQEAIAERVLSDPSFATLAPTLRRITTLDMIIALETYHEVERRKLEHEIERLEDQGVLLRSVATTDSLTGVANRGAILDLLDRKLAGRSAASALLVDVDRFKRINDSLGHLVGDEVLREVVRRINRALRAGDDALGRYGGEEFLVVLGATEDAARAVAERLRRAVADTPIQAQDEPLQVTVSVGGAEAVADESSQSVLARADQALYRAKKTGRNRVVFAGSDDTEDEPSS